jgi:hypothetical protein
MQLTLPPELEMRLREEAERRRQPAETVALQLLDQHLPPVDETARRIHAAKTLEEMFAAADAASDPEDGYDLLEQLDKNREGQRPLFPPEMKGISW